MAESDEGREIALTTFSHVSKILGIAVPGAGLPSLIIEAVQERNVKRWRRRMDTFLKSTELRLSALEQEDAESVPTDLFDDIMESAVAEEDESKIPYYAALVELTAAQKPEAYEVRVLGSVLRFLTVHELRGFRRFAETGDFPELPPGLEGAFWNRIEGIGLSKGGSVKRPVNITKIGHRLTDICRSAEEPSKS